VKNSPVLKSLNAILIGRKISPDPFPGFNGQKCGQAIEELLTVKTVPQFGA
jgi:hypothetical protein